jgi:3-demethoxyubiquinol 3-hydroxylase
MAGFCGVGGFALGLVTGLCRRAAIAATTVAVEAVVLRHLEAQIAALASVDLAAVSSEGPASHRLRQS